MSLLPNAHLQYIDHLMRETPGFTVMFRITETATVSIGESVITM
jgi:hypothetical protein